MIRSALAALLVFTCTACGRASESPTAPGEAAQGETDLRQDVGPKWSPYVGVHATGQALQVYRDALSILQRAGRLEGARVEISKQHQNPSDPVIKAIGGLGLELLGLIGNEYLFEPDIERQIDRIFAAYPEIRYFQIGNEVTTILPPTGPTITIERYMDVFHRVYAHVQARHPGRAVLLTQATLGFGVYGPAELERMAQLGLADLDPNQVIIAVNAYDPEAAVQYRGLLGSTLRRFRVWVTESGVPDPERHVEFVRDKYPLIRNYLRAERVYWYVMWGGDSGTDADFSLVKHPASYPHYWKSPLFNLLAGGE
jgi:hypothetical protein